MKSEKERIEKALRKKEIRDFRKKVKADYFKDYGKFHIAWFKELASKYKERGEFPLIPTLISEYYSNSRDKEVALLVTMCMKWDSDDIYKQVQSVRKVIGEHPYLWFRNQEYKSLGLPRNQDAKVEGYRRGHFWKISQIAQYLYDMCDECDGFLPFEKVFTMNRLPDVIDSISRDYDFGERPFRGRMLDVVFRTADGIGKGLWSVPDGYKVLCPVNSEIKEFLSIWNPDYKVSGRENTPFTFDEAVSLFGFDNDSDFLYAFWGWKELCKRYPIECGIYQARYPVWYKTGALKWPCEWRNIQPKIDF